MKKKRALIIGIVLAVAVAAVILAQSGRLSGDSPQEKASTAQPAHDAHSAPAGKAAARVPAYLEAPPGKGSLAPVLAPENFFGPAREAYRAAREIPQTIAQLPCYCHCDKSIGHKSLHSCFENDHAAHCAVCVNEALEAYRLQKEQGLTPAQIRERIIAEYSALE
ncbi:MAG TPA: CYCXC family (seleno)protein [Pyrinomonadaceae bacterium]|jgi:hypothetical protein